MPDDQGLGVKVGNKELVARGSWTVGVLLILLSVGAQVWVTDLMRKDLLAAIGNLGDRQAHFAAQLQAADEKMIRLSQINSCLNTLGAETTKSIRDKLLERRPQEAFNFLVSYCPWLVPY